jgi:DNA-directed RNA polymerase subunit RPC12/RpoP
MKAINCPQCGAVIEDVFERSVIIDCDYCGARIMLDERRREPEPRPVQVATPDFEPSDPTTPPVFKLIGIAVGVMFVLFAIGGLVSISRDKPKPDPPSTLYSAPSPKPGWTPSAWAVSTEVPEKPLPIVNYEPRMSWEGPADNEYFESPEVDFSKVANLTSEEVRKTVFKNRVVKLRVVIGTEGEITDVKTISGHPLLVEAATASARKSVFNSRSKPTTRILTYTFRVLQD